MATTKVLIVDDSALVRKVLREILSANSDVEVVGTARDPYEARDKIKSLHPDVITLDIEMPRMDGLTFLRNLMRLHPMPVIMVSSLTQYGADTALQALELGAIDYVPKPKIGVQEGLLEYAETLVEKVKIASVAQTRPCKALLFKGIPEKRSVEVVVAKRRPPVCFRTTEKIVAIGASTGGTEAIREVLSRLPASMPGMVITQHIPATFSKAFAERMNQTSAMSVKEAEDGDQILLGHVYIAPGDRHLLVERDGARYRCRLSDGPPVNRHRPSVDVLFRTVAQNVGRNGVGVILTGMGADGAEGLREMKEAGSTTIAQDESSSVVWSMPREAIERKAVDDIVEVTQVAQKLSKLCNIK